MLSGAFHVLSFSQWYLSIWSLMSIMMVLNDGKPLNNHLLRRIKKRLCFYSSLVLNLRDVQHCDRHEACSRQTKIMVITVINHPTYGWCKRTENYFTLGDKCSNKQLRCGQADLMRSYRANFNVTYPILLNLQIVLIYSGTIYRPYIIKCWDQRGKCQLTSCIILKSKKINIFTCGTD